MDILDDVCLVEILKQLTLTDQIQAFKTTRHFHHPLRLIWQSQSGIAAEIRYDEMITIKDGDFYILLENIHLDLRKLTFRYSYDDSQFKFSLLKSFEFPKVSVLVVCSDDLGDHKIGILIKMCPNVEKLIFSSCYGGVPKINLEQLEQFKCLKDLELGHCDFGQSALIQLLQNNGIRSLQINDVDVEGDWAYPETDLALVRLTLVSEHLGLIPIPKMTNLKEVSISHYFRWPEIVARACVLLTNFCPNAQIELQHVCDELFCCLELEEMNILRLGIFAIEEKSVTAGILNFLSDSKTLREVSLRHSSVDDKDLEEFMVKSRVDVISFRDCVFNTSVFFLDALHIGSNRSTPLIARLSRNMEVTGEHERVVIERM